MSLTFPKGGVHPPENKISANKKIEFLPIPKQVSIPISQHIGAPAKPIVKKNDEVKTGQLIAEASGFISANIHSSVTGKVNKIAEIYDTSGYKQKAIIIDVAEKETWADDIDTSEKLNKEIKASPQEIIDTVNKAGVVGLGGATFPSFVKLSIPKGKTAEILILNGVECEPYLTSDHQLMLEKADEMLIGVQILMKAINVKKAVIGIENNKKDAIKLLSDLCNTYEGISVASLQVKYPQGGEKQLIKAITGREVPSGELPISVGAVVHNVGTAYAVYEAVQKNKPLIERVVSITGKSVQKPGNYLARIGTPISDIIAAGGGIPKDTSKVISGGPMMGKALNSLAVPIAKGVSGVLIIADKEAKRKETLNCIRCAKCLTVCAMGLEPYLLMTLGEQQKYEEAQTEKVMDCIECGSCSFVCPSNRPILDYIRLCKSNKPK